MQARRRPSGPGIRLWRSNTRQRHVQALLDAQRRRVRRALGPEDVHDPALDELTEFVVAVNQSPAVMSRASTPIADLRAVVRIACSAGRSVLSSTPPHGGAEAIE